MLEASGSRVSAGRLAGSPGTDTQLHLLSQGVLSLVGEEMHPDTSGTSGS